MPDIENKDGEGTDNSGGGDKPVAPVTPTPPVAVTAKKIELTEEELNERIQSGIRAAQEAAEAEAQRKAAIESGQIQKVLDDTEAKLHKTQLALWRSRALAKHKLADVWFDALNGENEKDIEDAAKALKKRLDDEFESRKRVLDETPGTPPNLGGKPKSSSKPQDGETTTRKNIEGAFNIGGLTRRNYR